MWKVIINILLSTLNIPSSPNLSSYDMHPSPLPSLSCTFGTFPVYLHTFENAVLELDIVFELRPNQCHIEWYYAFLSVLYILQLHNVFWFCFSFGGGCGEKGIVTHCWFILCLWSLKSFLAALLPSQLFFILLCVSLPAVPYICFCWLSYCCQ